MKKIALALLATAICASPSFAEKGEQVEGLWCGYSDNFHLARDSVPATIASLSGDANVVVGQINTTSFFIKDVPECHKDGGQAKVRYQKDSKNYCDLVIHDGENINTPEITSNCVGSLHFAGKEYDGWRTYSYSLSFY